jgi:hypothetical protein
MCPTCKKLALKNPLVEAKVLYDAVIFHQTFLHPAIPRATAPLPAPPILPQNQSYTSTWAWISMQQTTPTETNYLIYGGKKFFQCAADAESQKLGPFFELTNLFISIPRQPLNTYLNQFRINLQTLAQTNPRISQAFGLNSPMCFQKVMDDAFIFLTKLNEWRFVFNTPSGTPPTPISIQNCLFWNLCDSPIGNQYMLFIYNENSDQVFEGTVLSNNTIAIKSYKIDTSTFQTHSLQISDQSVSSHIMQASQNKTSTPTAIPDSPLAIRCLKELDTFRFYLEHWRLAKLREDRASLISQTPINSFEWPQSVLDQLIADLTYEDGSFSPILEEICSSLANDQEGQSFLREVLTTAVHRKGPMRQRSIRAFNLVNTLTTEYHRKRALTAH